MHPYDRRRSLAAGVFFLLTFATSIPGALLYGPILTDPHYVVAGPTAPVLAGALLEIALVIANLGTALVLYPVLRRTSPSLALAYVVARVMESALIAVGILSLLAVVTLRENGAASGGTEAAAVVVAQALVALHGWTFLLGPGFVVGLGNGLILGWMLFRAGLVPRGWAVLGMIAGPLVSLSGVAVLLGAYDQVSPWSAVATLPEFVWEAFLGIYLSVRGFRAGSPDATRAPTTVTAATR
ncbi:MULTISPECIES: DUF4386 domain-containing protein [unclassified Leifsonia]|uniref:DUF4386 domain-containing protein n=1 Tax=unclassified Leifsonia TaxID=2663824 RepID=UPI0008A78AAA|nr:MULTISPECIES: DUF4386 domain-containing protein [unclassified Leifsonia]SEI05928.1 protein of unknown function [Leifsonia sp. CL154]SFL77458.1 protein of unknown function [Leifsonia sp. CL147]